MTEKIKLMFLCTGNSCRSQMAEGWARHLRGDKIEVWSAGLDHVRRVFSVQGFRKIAADGVLHTSPPHFVGYT